MRLVSRKWDDLMESDAAEIIPDDEEDTWHLYNLIQPGDFVAGTAIRKVKLLGSTGTGAGPSELGGAGTHSERMIIQVTLRVTSTSYDPVIGGLRITGRNLRQSDYIPLGASQSMDVQLHMSLRLAKADGWDSVSEEMLQDGLKGGRAGESGGIAAVVMDESAANICLVTPNRTVLRVKVTASKARKDEAAGRKKAGAGRRAGSRVGAATDNPYFDTALATLRRTFDFADCRPLILASPGFTAANFKTFVGQRAAEVGRGGGGGGTSDLKNLAREARVIATPSGSLHGLGSVMSSPEMNTLMANMRFTQESRQMDRFMEVHRLDDGRAHYGTRPVEKAVAAGAVGPSGLLLISNSLFRSRNLAERRRFVSLVDTVKAAGGEVRILSSEHESGRRLGMLGNVAAVLNFPMPDLDEDEDEDEDDGQEEDREDYEAAAALRASAAEQRRRKREGGQDEGEAADEAVASLVATF